MLGPNGAGKTTTLETCEGYRRPQSGRVRVLGLDPVRDRPALLPRLGVMLQAGGAWSGVRAEEMLRHVASLHAHPLPVDLLVERLGLAECGSTPYRRLSGGQQQRLGLAMAVVGRPELLVVDEPTVGMDPAARRDTWDLLREMRDAGVTIVLTTHHMEEAERLADLVHVIDRGRVIASGSPLELTRTRGDATIRLVVTEPFPPDAPASLRDELGGDAEVTAADAAEPAVSGTADPSTLATVSAWCERHGVVPESLALGRRTLEDVFLQLTGRELRRWRSRPERPGHRAVERLHARARRRAVRRHGARAGRHGGPAPAAQRRAAAARRGHAGARAARRRRGRPAARPLAAGPGGRRAHPRRARAGDDVDLLHLARHRDRLRAPLRAAQAARGQPAPPAGLLLGKVGALLGVQVLQVVVIGGTGLAAGVAPRAGGAAVPAFLLAAALGTAAFAGLALALAGSLRAEATLAAANLVYLLLLSGGAVVLPRSSYGAAGDALALLPSGRPRRRRAGGLPRRLAGARPPRGPGGLGRRRDPARLDPLPLGVMHVLRSAGPRARPALAVAGGRGRPGRQHRDRADRRGRAPDRLRARLPHVAAVHPGSYRPHGELGWHGAIEFGNRMLTWVLVAVAIAAVVVARRAGHRLATRLTTGIALGIPAQALLGGVTVLTDLNPWVVGLHFLLSMALVAACVVLLDVLRGPPRRAASDRTRGLALATVAVGWVVLWLGTVVTGSGPHSGDLDARRTGLDPRDVSHWHAWAVYGLVALSLALLVAARRAGDSAVVGPAAGLLAVEVAQGVVGFVQYATDLPEGLVALHLLGAAALSGALALVAVRCRGRSPDPVTAEDRGAATVSA